MVDILITRKDQPTETGILLLLILIIIILEVVVKLGVPLVRGVELEGGVEGVE